MTDKPILINVGTIGHVGRPRACRGTQPGLAVSMISMVSAPMAMEVAADTVAAPTHNERLKIGRKGRNRRGW